MTTLTITVGLPGSGKTTMAREWVAEDPKTRVRVNRDDIRFMINGAYLGTRTQEDIVTSARDAMVIKMLRVGMDVITDDTNLRWSHITHMRRIAELTGSEFTIRNFLHVSTDTCITRDRNRPNPVGADVINNMMLGFVRDSLHGLRNVVTTEIVGILGCDRDHATSLIDATIADPNQHEWIVALSVKRTADRIAGYAESGTTDE